VPGKSSSRERDEIRRRLQAASTVLAVTHARADGDALGSALALVRAARAAGKSALLLIPDRVPPRYNWLVGDEQPFLSRQFTERAQWADAIVIVDTCAAAQLDEVASQLEPFRGKTVVIDHHATNDDIGAVRWIDTSAAATGILVGELLAEIDWPMDLPTAEHLAIAITTDTGWLRFSSTDGRCLRAVASLVDAGVRPDRLYRRLFENERPERFKLSVRMLDGMELLVDGRLAVLQIRKEDFARTGARPDETENLVNEPLKIATVEAVALLTEQEECIRISFRSREALDVSAVAGCFGGGGHARAAGARVEAPLAEVRKRVVEVMIEALTA